MKYLRFFFLLSATYLSGQTLSTLTYNIRYDNPNDSLNGWHQRKANLISQLAFCDLDVFGTQEGLLHQLKDIKTSLKEYAFIGKGREDGKEAGEFSAIFYHTKKLRLLTDKTFWLSETPDQPSKGWDAAIKRVCTYALFETKKERQRFYVFNTHFDHVGEQARRQSTRLIIQKIKEINHDKLPVLLMGDFNLEPEDPSIEFLSKQMDDAHNLAGEQAHGPSGTFNGFNFSEAVTRRIDYIFLSRGEFKVLKYAILNDTEKGRYPSDHLPVHTKLKFGE